MANLTGLCPEKVFGFFEELCAIPHGSENMEEIAAYCLDFARARGLKAISDAANNVVIYLPASPGYESAEPIILQGHLDMVCQKEQGKAFDFEVDAITPLIDGDFVCTDGTTLGADNGIAVAMILAILDGDATSHPAIEAVFTTDEEIGMIGASKLDMSALSGNRMINLDAEEDNTLTVSCAGGSDLSVTIPLEQQVVTGQLVTVRLFGLLGGHSGVEINKGRVNATVLAGRFLHTLQKELSFSIGSITGGDKGNAIPAHTELELITDDAALLQAKATTVLASIQSEISAREPGFSFQFAVGDTAQYSVMTDTLCKKVIEILVCTPNGIQEMSASIEGLVETSLNLGVCQTKEDGLYLQYALRSNLCTALEFLHEKMRVFFAGYGCNVTRAGVYPPWEFKAESELQALYQRLYLEEFGKPVQVAAIHAGLECGMFAASIPNLDCIAIGPNLFDVHTPKERMSISSVAAIYRLLLRLLAEAK